MLFNSPEFLFGYLPATLAIVFLLARFQSHLMAATWLMIASLFFYAWWNPSYIALLILSILGNYYIGGLIRRSSDRQHQSGAKLWLTLGIGANLLVLFYFKYFEFFLGTLNHLFSTSLYAGSIYLPLAISFFTFQQIAYLVEVYRGQAAPSTLSYYSLFQ